MKLDQREIARYLGLGGRELSRELSGYAEECERELFRSVTPRSVSRTIPVSSLPGESRDLAHHLRHCSDCVLYAVTLGAETDRLLRRWSAQSMAKAAVGQAVCAVWLDELCADLCGGLTGEGQYLTPPFSPGYGDWDLSVQGTLLDLLSAHKRIGLTLTGGGMLAPEKSVTAVVGLSDREEESCGQKCMRCRKTDCPFRSVLPQKPTVTI